MLKRVKKNRVILLEEGNPLSWKIAKKYHKVYVYSGDLRKAEKLPDDILSQIDFYFSNYQAGCEIDWVYGQYIKKNEIKSFNEIMQDERAHFIIKKKVLQSLGGLFFSFILVERFIEQYGIKEPIDFIPSPFSYSLYQIVLQKKDLLCQQVNIPESYVKVTKYREAIKNSRCRANLLLYPFWIALIMSIKRSVSESRKKYRYGVHVWNSWIRLPPYRVDFLEAEDCVNPKNALYIIDGDVSKSNLLKVKENGYDSCCFKEMLQGYPVWKYIKENIFYHLKLCAKCFSMCKRNKLLLTESCLRGIQGYVRWEIFYTRYDIDLFITFQEPGNIWRALVQKKHGAKSLFVFWSTSYDPVYRRNMNTHADSYFSFMIYDAMISSYMSNEYFKRNNNFIKKYINNGIIGSDIIFQMKHDKKAGTAMKEKLGLPSNKIIIGFFDTSIGRRGMFTNHEGLKMLNDIYRLLESSEEYFIIFRSRAHYARSKDINLKKAANKLIGHKRVLYINRSAAQYSASDVMGVCDLVIGSFTSSAPLESVSGGIRTLCYGSSEGFDKDVFVVNSFPRFRVHSYNDLKKNAEYWLYQCSERDFLNFQRRYICKDIDNYCDGKAVKRLHSMLRQYSKQAHEN